MMCFDTLALTRQKIPLPSPDRAQLDFGAVRGVPSHQEAAQLTVFKLQLLASKLGEYMDRSIGALL